ncbi:ATP-binding protein [Algoriphagus sp. PAP.12]|uniref:ATP-binding protein n=1 Tax=Algoriphagus sp. PAP.12 TaxID=2996678 RepID=UPI00227D5119|nr:ATP-binding protein [Algoriphagus sp. PAP.12]
MSPNPRERVQEALDIYYRYWESYLTGNQEEFTDVIDDTYELIGTSESEICHNKAEGIDFFKSQKDEIVGVTEMRNRKVITKDLENMVLILEDCDLYIFSETGWSLYSALRLSTLMRLTDLGWKVSQQHGSFPDYRVKEGETLAIEKITKENLELKDAVKRRTLELESKNRELEIQNSLERIRGLVAAMKESQDLLEIMVKMRSEFVGLGHEAHYFWHMRWLSEKYEKAMTSGDGGQIGMVMTLPRQIHGDIQEVAEWEKGSDPIFVLAMDTETAVDYVHKMVTWGDFEKIDPQAPTLDDIRHIGGLTFVMARTSHGEIGYSLPGVVPNPPQEDMNTLVRFAKVFDLAYKRFEDLKKAEEQAREGQIEVALERVRTSAMAMRHSDDLENCTKVVFDELEKLELNMERSGIGIFNKENRDCQLYTTVVNPKGKKELSLGITSLTIHPMLIQTFEAWENQKALSYTLEGKDLKDYYDIVSHSEFILSEEVLKKSSGLSKEYYHYSPFSAGGLYFFSDVEPKTEDKRIIKRFAEVFDMTYTRFLDLQKAEAQARESQIEAALERVRSRTMAMHRSDELADASALLEEEVKKLGIQTWGCAFHIYDETPTEEVAWDLEWFTSAGGMLPFYKTPREYMFLRYYENSKKGKPLYIEEFGPDVIERHYEYLKSLPILGEALKELSAKGVPLPPRQYDHVAYFKHGHLLFITYEPIPDAHDIFIRFAKVFDQTYTRFLDLQKAEAQAREAQIELSLERIRAQVTAMRESSDLFDIVVNMRKEFISLGHEADYFWHMKWLKESYEMSMTSEDGNRIGMVISLPKHVHESYPELAKWETGIKPSYVMALNGEEAWRYLENMNTHGHYEQADPNAPTKDEILQLGGLTFILARTSHGEIGFSLAGEIPNPPQESIDTLVRFAGVFDLAYKRFEDLKKAEANALKAAKDLIVIKEAKKKAEKALIELKAAQEQLIQQEKLASLGQLTAGIAHEIKNPLNFVNNFSELSTELIDEVFDELENLESSDTKEEIKAILEDVKSNLVKVHEHGSRADSIVKSMLQHSRSSGTKLESKEINPIIKEFVNLAFHGMRAGKNPINVTIDLQLDEHVGELKIISEDFSRVILNLCNNAFDAMRDKLNSLGSTNYEARLTVITKASKNRIQIKIQDNGPGIPNEIRDKVLQPFFTTKKGTEGTGLGLSISHDIVKAHGGEIKIDSEEDKGTTFFIQLPLN